MYRAGPHSSEHAAGCGGAKSHPGYRGWARSSRSRDEGGGMSDWDHDGLERLLTHYEQLVERGCPESAKRGVHILFEAYRTFLRQLRMVRSGEAIVSELLPKIRP